MGPGYEDDDHDDIRALVAGPPENGKRISQFVRRKGFVVDSAYTFEEAQELTSRHNYAVAVLDMGEGDFAETSWVELLESLGVETKLFCLIPEDLDEELVDRLKNDEAILIQKPCEAEDLEEPLRAIVRSSSAEHHVPRIKSSKGQLRMREYDDN